MIPASAHVRKNRARAFSLIELVIVVVIIGIIAAIAIPRMSRGAAGAGDNALASNLATLRKAIDLYAAEHDGAFPPGATNAEFVDAMTKFSNGAGTSFQATKDATHVFGPYLRSVPPMNSGANKGVAEVTTTAGQDGGWLYNATTGEIRADAGATETDSGGSKLLNDY